MRIKGRVSPAKAAQMIGVHVQTVRNWCQQAVNGEPSRLHDVLQHITGYYWIDVDEVRAIRKSGVRNEDDD